MKKKRAVRFSFDRGFIFVPRQRWMDILCLDIKFNVRTDGILQCTYDEFDSHEISRHCNKTIWYAWYQFIFRKRIFLSS